MEPPNNLLREKKDRYVGDEIYAGTADIDR